MMNKFVTHTTYALSITIAMLLSGCAHEDQSFHVTKPKPVVVDQDGSSYRYVNYDQVTTTAFDQSKKSQKSQQSITETNETKNINQSMEK